MMFLKQDVVIISGITIGVITPMGITIIFFFQVYDKTTLEDLRNKSVLLTGYLEWMVRKHFSKSESDPDRPYIKIFTPTDPEQRGCQLSLNFSIHINTIFKKLTEQGVVVSTV